MRLEPTLLHVSSTRPFISPQPMDILVGVRNNTAGRLIQAVGEPWTHVAITLDGRNTFEIGPDGVFTRTVEAFRRKYRAFGIARPSMSLLCAERVVAKFDEIRRSMPSYSWTKCLLMELAGALRSTLPAVLEPTAVAISRRLSSWSAPLLADTLTTCSLLIDQGLRAACEACWPRLAWPTRRRIPFADQQADVTEVRPDPEWAVRDKPVIDPLVWPADIWTNDAFGFRVVERRGEAVLIVDAEHIQRGCLVPAR